MREINLPPHLYDRIKASAGEHGGIGAGECFTREGFPLCAHGHAWGSADRFMDAPWIEEPDLARYLSYKENDNAIPLGADRISFERWCRLLNVKRGEEAPVERPEKLDAVAA